MYHNMIPNSNGNGVLVIGGTPDFSENYDGIHELICVNGLKDCQWKTLEQKLKFARRAFVSMLIPDSLANDLCLKKKVK